MKRRLRDFFSWSALNSIGIALKMVFKIKNWQNFFLNYIGLLSTHDDIVFRNGMRFTVNDPFDIATIAVVCLRNEYGRVKKGSTVIDIGANIGAFSIMAAKKGAIVYAYEPMKDTYRSLTKNVLLSDVPINAFNLGIADKKSVKNLFINDDGSAFNSMYGSGRHIMINCISLDDVFKNNKIEYCDLLKIDTEGAEYETFYNASGATLKKIKNIRMEYHNTNGNNVDDLIYFLYAYGFKIVKRRDDNKFSGIVWLKNGNI